MAYEEAVSTVRAAGGGVKVAGFGAGPAPPESPLPVARLTKGRPPNSPVSRPRPADYNTP